MTALWSSAMPLANFSVAEEKAIAAPPKVGFISTDKKTEGSK